MKEEFDSSVNDDYDEIDTAVYNSAVLNKDPLKNILQVIREDIRSDSVYVS